MPTCSYRGFNFFLILFDDSMSHGWTVNLKHKSDADLAIWQFIAMVRTQYNKVICEFEIDAGGEFKLKELTEFFKELSVNILTSILHMHQQNSRAECFIRTIMDKSQAIWPEFCAPQSWWEFAVDCAVHVYNCTPIQCHNWKTPLENLTHTKPDVTHFRVFGCGVYVFLPEEVRHNKLNQMASRVSITFLQKTMSMMEMGVDPCPILGLDQDLGCNCFRNGRPGNLSRGIHHYHPVCLIALYVILLCLQAHLHALQVPQEVQVPLQARPVFHNHQVHRARMTVGIRSTRTTSGNKGFISAK
jgi:uncharacterized protein YqfB (UPF0267 family)